MKKQQTEVQKDLEVLTTNKTIETSSVLVSTQKWPIRLWYAISNIFYYIFLGYIRF